MTVVFSIVRLLRCIILIVTIGQATNEISTLQLIDESNGQVDRWTLNGTRLSSTFFLCSLCAGLFVDVNNRLYCSGGNRYQVMRRSFSASWREPVVTDRRLR